MNLLHEILPLFLLLATPAWSWGMLGHRTTALLASRFLDPSTARAIRQILKPQSLVSASTWADYYSHTHDGRYSAPWHWIDAKDSPPSICNLTFSRDCPKDQGCIVSAIKNHTARATDLSVEWTERQMSLKWVVHFLGDIHQPLHTEDLLRGGNGVHVEFDGRQTNLHHVWDSSIAEKLVGGNSYRAAAGWADKLHKEIIEDGGRWSNQTMRSEKWGGCLDITRAEDCAIEWATETNRWMCDYVLPNDYPEKFKEIDLGGEYYDGAVGIVEELVARAGWRMAGWLNMMFSEGGRDLLEDMVKATREAGGERNEWLSQEFQVELELEEGLGGGEL